MSRLVTGFRPLLMTALLVLVLGLALPAMATAPGGHEAAPAASAGHEAAASGGHEAAAAGDHGAATHKSGPSDNQFWDFIWRLMNFGVLAIVLIFLLRKPLSQGLRNRSENIKAELEELEAKREEARREYAVLEGRLKEAEGERELILEEFRAQGEREKAKIVAEAHTLAERVKAQAQFTIEQETEAAKTELKREIADMSSALAEDLLKKNINDSDQARLVDEYLERVQREAQ